MKAKKCVFFILTTMIVSLCNFAMASEPWAPYQGSSKVNQSMTFQTFYFDNLSYFGSNSTYEHETQVYNTNFADYNGYWSSNMPLAYYDTPFLDSIDNFTVGTPRANYLTAYRQYYTRMDLRPGSTNTATVRIKGQKGHRSPSGCNSTWCIFADATTGSLTTINAPIYSYVYWTY